MTRSSADGHLETATPHWIEWVTGIVSVMLVCGLLGWIGWDSYRYRDEVADFKLTTISIEPGAGSHRVTFDIHNLTQTTAAKVHVVGTLQNAASGTETADVTFDYVASESHNSGTLIFASDPATGRLQLRVAGFTEP